MIGDDMISALFRLDMKSPNDLYIPLFALPCGLSEEEMLACMIRVIYFYISSQQKFSV